MFRMTVADVFFIRGRGTVATGQIADGVINVGDNVQINGGPPLRVDGIEAFRKLLDQAKAGDNVGLLFTKLDRKELMTDDVITAEGAAAGPAEATTTSGGSAQFAQATAQRAQFLTMRDAGLMSDTQIDDALRALAFTVDGRRWALRADTDAWYSSTDGEHWSHDTPPG